MGTLRPAARDAASDSSRRFRDIGFRSVGHAYTAQTQTVETLADVDFTVRRGEFVTVVGPSGCGKSTLFNLAAGLIAPTRGRVEINGYELKVKNPHVAYMFQQPALLAWRSVIDNVIFGAELLGESKADARARAITSMETFGLQGFERRMPWELSGGMRQRVALLRTYMTERELLLLDEPFGALDALTRLQMQQFLLDTWERDQRTVLFITHDVDEAVLLGDRVVILSSRPASVVDEVRIDMSRPRVAENLIGTPRFTEYKLALLEHLRNSG